MKDQWIAYISNIHGFIIATMAIKARRNVGITFKLKSIAKDMHWLLRRQSNHKCKSN